MERGKKETIGATPIEAQEARRDGSFIVRLANHRPDRAVEPNSDEAMAIARGVKKFYDDRKQITPSIWKERAYGEGSA